MSKAVLDLKLAWKSTGGILYLHRLLLTLLLLVGVATVLQAQDIDMFEIVNRDPPKFGDDLEIYQEQLENPKQVDGVAQYRYTKPKRILFMGFRAENASMGFCSNKLCELRISFGSTYEDFEYLRDRIIKLYGRPSKLKKSFSMKETVTWRYQGVQLVIIYNPSRLYTEVNLSHAQQKR